MVLNFAPIFTSLRAAAYGKRQLVASSPPFCEKLNTANANERRANSRQRQQPDKSREGDEAAAAGEKQRRRVALACSASWTLDSPARESTQLGADDVDG
jgi:hypothetical protein